MHFDLTNHENIIFAFAFLLIAIFALAAFLDNIWGKAEALRDFGSDHSPKFPPENDSAGQDMPSNLYVRYADLSACGLGLAGQQITFRGETPQNLAITKERQQPV